LGCNPSDHAETGVFDTVCLITLLIDIISWRTWEHNGNIIAAGQAASHTVTPEKTPTFAGHQQYGFSYIRLGKYPDTTLRRFIFHLWVATGPRTVSLLAFALSPAPACLLTSAGLL
jgi:hypothetical protein